jgi:hypothetical protein
VGQPIETAGVALAERDELISLVRASIQQLLGAQPARAGG